MGNGIANPNLGYSLLEGALKDEWIGLVTRLRALSQQIALTDHYVFHGTSARIGQLIMDGGMTPTVVSHAVPAGVTRTRGSFWGDVEAAVSYAEDTVFEREGCGSPTLDNPPILIAVPIRSLEERFPLFPDLATLEAPVDGLTKLDQPGVSEFWWANYDQLGWKESLRDLGAIVALHKNPVRLKDAFMLSGPDELVAIEEKMGLSPLFDLPTL